MQMSAQMLKAVLACMVLSSRVRASSVEVVVAHHREDLSWLSRLPEDLRIRIYTKGSQLESNQPPHSGISQQQLPNLGRESHTYISHIVTNYEHLADWTVFTQGGEPSFGYKGHRAGGGHLLAGDDFANYLTPHSSGSRFVYTSAVHLPSMNHVLRAAYCINDELLEGGAVRTCPRHASQWTPWWDIGDFHGYISSKVESQHGEGIIDFYHKYINPAHTGDEVTVFFPQGARFAVSREIIQRRPKAHYEQLLRTLSGDIDPYAGYFMEWLWSEFFLGHQEPCTLPARVAPVSHGEAMDSLVHRFPKAMERLLTSKRSLADSGISGVVSGSVSGDISGHISGGPSIMWSCVGNDSRCKGSNEATCKALGAEGSDCKWEAQAQPSSSGLGECIGNDSRCEGSSRGKCKRLGMEGADCKWEGQDEGEGPTTSDKPSDSDFGECVGNDSRCEGSSQGKCKGLGMEGADCKWRGLDPEDGPTTSDKPSDSGLGECIGNDSRCEGSSQGKCNALGLEGSDCKWEVPVTPSAPGECLGNDSRCSGSSHARCIRLSDTGSDCRWESSMWSSGSLGTCLGNDSRCSGSTEQTCNFLTEEGSDCKWRSAFTVSGSMIVTVSDLETARSSDTVKDAVIETISNITSIPPEYVDVDVAIEDGKRRLRASQISETGNLRVTYVIAVPGDAPETIEATGAEVGDRLKAASSTTIENLISTNAAESEGSGSITVSIQNVEEPEVVVKSSSRSSVITSRPPSDNGDMRSGAKMETLTGRFAAISLMVALSSLQHLF